MPVWGYPIRIPHTIGQIQSGCFRPPCRRRIAIAVGDCQIIEREEVTYPDDVGVGLEIGDRVADGTVGGGADVEAFDKIDREETDPIPGIETARP